MPRYGNPLGTVIERPEELAERWLADYRREQFDDDGDPWSIVERANDLAEDSGPQTTPALALPIFLGRLAADDDSI